MVGPVFSERSLSTTGSIPTGLILIYGVLGVRIISKDV